MSTDIADLLGLDANRAKAYPGEITKQAFFEHLASHGIVPQSEAEAIRLLQGSDELEAKHAEMAYYESQAKQAASPVNQALDTLVPRVEDQPVVTPDMIRQLAAQKTAGIMQDPVQFGALLSAFTDD